MVSSKGDWKKWREIEFRRVKQWYRLPRRKQEKSASSGNSWSEVKQTRGATQAKCGKSLHSAHSVPGLSEWNGHTCTKYPAAHPVNFGETR